MRVYRLWLGTVAAASLATSGALAQTASAPVQLDTIEVQGVGQPIDTPPGTTGYVATETTTAAKTTTPVREIPQSVSTVTRQQLNDRDVQTLGEAITYSPGVSTNASGVLSDFDRFYIRGFEATTDVFRDGLRQGGAGYGVPKVEPYGLESLSILRGPASGLYGLGSPGGIVDVVTKRPSFTPFNEVQLQLGQYDRYQGNFDLTGPVAGNPQFAYRLTGLFRESNTNLPGENDNRAYLAPAFRWQPDSDTSVTILGEIQQARTSANDLFYSANHRIRYYANDPRYGAFDQNQARIGYEIEHRFTDWLTVRQKFRYYNVFADAKYTDIYAVDESVGKAYRYTGHDRDVLNTVSLDNQAEFRFRTGDIDHILLTGLNYNHLFNVSKYVTGTAPDLDLFTLNYGAQAIAKPIGPYSYLSRQTFDEFGLYAQEQARFGNFVLTLNGQQSWVSSNSVTNDVRTLQDDSAFTGRVGLAYNIEGGVTPYVSYATSFKPQPGTTISGTPFSPTTGDQKEVGVKYQMPGLPVLLTAALFDITQNNVLRTDPTNIAFQVATGQVESKGFEFEAVAALAEGLNLTASYSHLDIHVTRGDANLIGNKFSGIPEDSAAVFAKYSFQPGSMLAGLGVGLGVRYIGASYGDDENTFRNKPEALVDAVLDYDLSHIDPQFKGVRLQVNATNLLDNRFQSCRQGYCGLGEPQRVIGSLIYRF